MNMRYVRYAVIAVLLVVVVLVVSQLPRGYDTDLTQIGGGQPAVVMVHDHGIVQSGTLMSALDVVRDDFEDDLLILVADQNRDEGEQFAIRHELAIATIAAFNAEGELVDVYRGPERTPQELRGWLEEKRQEFAG